MTLMTLSYILCMVFIPSPMALNVSMILLAILVSLNLNIVSFSWFSFIVFLLYVGGMLVIFMYFSSLTPNQKFPLTVPLLIIIASSPMASSLFSSNFFSISNNFKTESVFLFSEHNLTMSLFFIVFLFVMLLVVVKLASNFKLPMRPLSYMMKCFAQEFLMF